MTGIKSKLLNLTQCLVAVLICSALYLSLVQSSDLHYPAESATEEVVLFDADSDIQGYLNLTLSCFLATNIIQALAYSLTGAAAVIEFGSSFIPNLGISRTISFHNLRIAH